MQRDAGSSYPVASPVVLRAPAQRDGRVCPLQEPIMAVENWVEVQQMQPQNWTCGYCGLNVGGNRG